MFYVDDGVGISFFDDGKKKGAKHNPSKYITYEIFICVKKRVSERERESKRKERRKEQKKHVPMSCKNELFANRNFSKNV